MIKYFCDVTGDEMEPNDLTKSRQDFAVQIADVEVHMRAYFCVNNEGSGELSMDGVMIFLSKLVKEYFGENYLNELDDENETAK